MKLYHGSKAGIVGEIAPSSWSCCDFGRGFYMVSEPTQPMTLICRMEKPNKRRRSILDAVDRNAIDVVE